MSGLSDQQIDVIARQLAGRLVPAAPAAVAAASGGAEAAPAPASGSDEPMGEGVFATVDECVAAARAAFEQLRGLSLARRKEIVAAYRAAMREHGDDLARQAWQETRIGRVEDKFIKNRLVTDKTPGPEMLEPRTYTGDDGLTLVEWAPFGVVGAITPTTNPTSTIICNTIGMVSAGNSVVFNAHPSARACSLATVRLLDRAAVSVGGPPNLVCAVAAPTIESAAALMHHQGINLLVVTGGPGVVKAAMNSGKRAICAGPGNPPVVVDATADLERAGRDIVRGASFDNNLICVDEKEVFVTADAAGGLLDAMRAAGAYVASTAEMARIEAQIFKETRGPRKPGVINKAFVGKNAGVILAAAGITAPGDVRLVVSEVPEDHPLVWTEQLMPVLPVVRVSHVSRGIRLAKEAEHGFGHSASMHSHDIDALSAMAREMNTSIFVKNGPIIAGLGAGGEGFASYTIASPTGEGMTCPVSFSRQRRCVMVDHFRIV
jgi:acyl-CoA reductase-like NAD-dependent aldehyde dehydrogenase